MRCSVGLRIAAVSWLMAVCLGSASVKAQERTITLQTLLNQMVDRDALARWPQPTFTERQASSYDRRSKTPDDPDGWFANDDWSHFIRSEENAGRREWVMLDAEGPGCIVRIWFGGMYPKGMLRFYLDSADMPAIEGNAYDILAGRLLANRPLSIENAHGIPGAPGGMNLFLPIPYHQHCKITYEEPGLHDAKTPPDGRWYNIEYRTYPPDTDVRTFTSEALKTARPVLERVCRTLLDPPPITGGTTAPLFQTLAPGQEAALALPAGPAAVRLLEAQLRTGDPKDREQALRSVVLRMECDGEETIWCPLGDFFGSGVGLNPLSSWYRTITPNGTLSCRWVMPYRKSARLSLTNLGKQTVTVTLHATVGRWRWDDRSLHFHANWRQQYPLPTRPHSDWNYITLTGQGVYVGDTLAVFNPVPDWWGEGDEKVYVDGESFPSHFGTGSEDYYGYSWGDTTLFQGPFSNQVRCDGPDHQGHTTVTRTRALDVIPFTQSLRFDMEVWHWADTNVAYAATTYWYARPGASSNRPPAPEEAARPILQVPGPRKVDGAFEAETMTITGKTGGVTELQTDRRWSGGKQLWWRDGKIGDRLELALPSTRSGRYTLLLSVTRAFDYGIFQVYLDDVKLAGPFNLYSPDVTLGEVSFGNCSLGPGSHRLVFEIVGADPRARPRYMLGLDYVKLVQESPSPPPRLRLSPLSL